MNGVVKYVIGRTYKPLLEKYLSRKRIYRHDDLTLEIPPEVFHPGFFDSTKLLLQQLDDFNLNGKTLLELGAGSGLISFHAVRKGALVTATDLNRVAVEYLHINSEQNNIDVEIIHSDLFCELPIQPFDFIVINPPYYKREAVSEKDLAWCCGSKGEYFERLFKGIGSYTHEKSEVLMVLCDGCDLQMIAGMAEAEGFMLHCISTHKTILETNFIFKIRRRIPGISVNRFENEYLSLREKEGRIYSDEELRELPTVSPNHPHAEEWRVREWTSIELSVYLRFSRVRRILEVGCGNGWLANKLASIPDSEVTAIDVNRTELEQGARVFKDTRNLRFVVGDLRNGILGDELFDVIVFAASIQYFENLDEILQSAFAHLRKGGEVHIVDSFIYAKGEVNSARQRSKKYFERAGFPLMMNYYFHHSIETLKKYNYRVMPYSNAGQKPGMPGERVFPWIIITRE